MGISEKLIVNFNSVINRESIIKCSLFIIIVKKISLFSMLSKITRLKYVKKVIKIPNF